MIDMIQSTINSLIFYCNSYNPGGRVCHPYLEDGETEESESFPRAIQSLSDRARI